MFRIRFQGLLTHAVVNGRRLVVVYQEPSHAALITANNSDILDFKGTKYDGPGVSCFSLFGNMELDNTEYGPVLATLSGMPKIADLCDGTKVVRPEIENRRPHPALLGYLDLEGGVLTLQDWFENHATFNGAQLQCLPRTVLFSTNATADTVRFTMNGDENYVVLKPHAEVWITNLDLREPDQQGDEYQAYRNFFVDATMVAAPVKSDSLCPYGAPRPTRSACIVPGTLSVQCSNNQYP
jgi:hypothetical protein